MYNGNLYDIIRQYLPNKYNKSSFINKYYFHLKKEFLKILSPSNTEKTGTVLYSLLFPGKQFE